MKEDERLKRMEEDLREVRRDLENIKNQIEEDRKLDRFGLDDFIQECIGALIIAFPVSMTEEIWEISQRISLGRVLLIALGALGVVYFFIKHSKLQRWESQEVAGFLPLRLITSSLIAFVISSLTLLALGVYPNFLNDLEWFFKTAVLVTVFSIVGSLGVDMIR
jgi:uncharacterized membrane protein